MLNILLTLAVAVVVSKGEDVRVSIGCSSSRGFGAASSRDAALGPATFGILGLLCPSNFKVGAAAGAVFEVVWFTALPVV